MSASSQLNPQQRKAVESIDGPLLVLAGAGAGKTRVIAERIRAIIRRGAEPESVLAITFTNKAAAEMRSRIGPGPFVSTFHSLGLTLIKENAKLLGYRRSPAIYDRADSLREMKRALKAVGAEDIEPRLALAIMSRAKGDGVALKEFSAQADTYIRKYVALGWQKYDEALSADNAVDFDDLLVKAVDLLKHYPDIRKKYQERWTYILVDEYQDTNRVQEDLIELLVGPEKNICVVGDLDQTIYGWRGAQIENIKNFEKKYGAERITLELNYRSTKNIVSAAEALINNNTNRFPKRIETTNGSGEKLTLYTAGDANGEALFVADKIKMLLGEGVRPKDIAILYRANAQSRMFEHSLNEQDIPNQVLGTRFYERKEIKDAIAYLRAALYETPADIERAVGTPPRGIGKITLLKMFMHQPVTGVVGSKVAAFNSLLAEIKEASKKLPPPELIKFVVQRSGTEALYKADTLEGPERLGNLYELITASMRFATVEAFLENVALQSEQDEIKEQRDAVRLMTIHAAKGLEFAYVFIVGLEEGLFPIEREHNSGEELEEERRLMYVAITRAKQKVFLSLATIRTVYGVTAVTEQSRFLQEIPEELIEEDPSGFAKSATNYLGNIEY